MGTKTSIEQFFKGFEKPLSEYDPPVTAKDLWDGIVLVRDRMLTSGFNLNSVLAPLTARQRREIEHIFESLSIPISNKGIDEILEIFSQSYTGLRDVASRYDEFFKDLNSFLNERIRTLSPLIGKLKTLRQYRKSDALKQAIKGVEYDVAQYKKLLRPSARRCGDLVPLFKSNKTPEQGQKQEFWNWIVRDASRVINEFCHDDTCPPRGTCRVMHGNALRAVTRIVKFLYPEVFPENEEIVMSRLKNKEYSGS